MKVKTLLAKLIVTVVVTVVCYFPAELYYSFKLLLKPQGFWQNFVLLGVGLWFLGAIQVVLLIVWIYLLLKNWTT